MRLCLLSHWPASVRSIVRQGSRVSSIVPMRKWGGVVEDGGSMRNLSGAVVLVTGAGAGIGAAEVKLLADRGAQVCAVDIDEDAARRSGAALTIGTDVADREAMAAVVDRAVEQFGKLDVVICNA